MILLSSILLLSGHVTGVLKFLSSDFESGTVEAFMYSVATEEQLQRANVLSFIFSMIYLGQNTLLRQSAGAVGLVVANSLSILSDFVHFPCSPSLILM